MRWLIPEAILILMTASCAPNAPDVTLRAPNPNGCYVVVYERAQFEGAADLLNGPVSFATLKAVPQANHGNWHNRIRSVRVGPAATVTMYRGASFSDHSARFRASTEHPAIDDNLAGHVQSLVLVCDPINR